METSEGLEDDFLSIEEIVNKAGSSSETIIKGKQKTQRGNQSNRRKDEKFKQCPVCGNMIYKRADGKCKTCGTPLFLVDGEYYTISKPQERLIAYTYMKVAKDVGEVDIKTVEDISKYIPSSDDFSPIKLKNEAWAANKLLTESNQSFDLAMEVIDTFFETKGGYISLYYLVSYPGIRALIHKARARLRSKRLNAQMQRESTDAAKRKQDLFNKPFGEDWSLD